MTRFRPCIDLHEGVVKQIVGGTLSDDASALRTNFVSDRDAVWYAAMYQADGLSGGHVIQLGPGNETAARSALSVFPQGLQIGGGVHLDNAQDFLDAGASHVIVTSWLFDRQGTFQPDHLTALAKRVGAHRIVVDLSCRRGADGWIVAMNRWQTATNLRVTHETLDALCPFCDEFLIHAADVEGQCQGIDEELVAFLGQWGKRPLTYAGGARSLEDLAAVNNLSNGRMDLSIGSALDIFGGSLIRYADCVAWNRQA